MNFYKLLIIYLSFFSSNLTNENDMQKTFNDNVKKAQLGNLNVISDPFEIISIELNNNILKAILSYKGGFNNHDFQLIGNDMISKSLPPRRTVKLIHHANNDSCNLKKIDTLFFDIRPLSYNLEIDSQIYLDLVETNYSILYTLK